MYKSSLQPHCLIAITSDEKVIVLFLYARQHEEPFNYCFKKKIPYFYSQMYKMATHSPDDIFYFYSLTVESLWTNHYVY